MKGFDHSPETSLMHTFFKESIQIKSLKGRILCKSLALVDLNSPVSTYSDRYMYFWIK